jgi:SAM-dependent methyltransferase
MHLTPENNAYYGSDLEAMLFAKNYGGWIFDSLKPYLGDTVAEVGAGSGNFSDLIIQSKVRQLYAFEPSNNMYPLLQKRIGHHANVEIFNSNFTEKHESLIGHLDSIIYINVLEHISNDDNELLMARNALQDGGYIFIFVPALSWLYSQYDAKIGHYRRYHKSQLKNKIEAAKLDIIDIRYFDIAGVIPWYINFVLLKKDMSKNGVQLYDKFIVPISRNFEQIVKPPIGKNILLIAQKK